MNHMDYVSLVEEYSLLLDVMLPIHNHLLLTVLNPSRQLVLQVGIAGIQLLPPPKVKMVTTVTISQVTMHDVSYIMYDYK